MRRLAVLGGLVAFVLGVACLMLALYMWFGAWPRTLRDTVDYYRSVAATEGRAPEPLIANVRARSHRSLSGVWNAVVDPRSSKAITLPLRSCNERIPESLRAKNTV